jgi:guanosine-3',5'-bis(diphosphate) 3'-pyrophosphohydrolase
MNSVFSDPLYLGALQFAFERHQGQTRKDVMRTPYIEHPIAVAGILINIGQVDDVEILAAALLHDVLEDTATKASEMKERFGDKVTRIVREVSDDKRLPRVARKYLQVRGAPFISNEAKLVKLGDKICNLRDILDAPPMGWDGVRKAQYFEWANAVVDGLRGVNLALECQFDAVFARKSEL